MRVLHVVEASLGGVRRYIEGIAAVSSQDFLRNGLVYSAVRADSQFFSLVEKLRSSGWSTFEVPMERDIAPIKDLVAVGGVRRALKAFDADLVHCHSSKAGAIGRIALRTLPRPRPAAAYTPNAIAVRLGRRFHVAEWLLGRLLTDLIIAISDSERDELVETGVIAPHRIAVLWPFIDTEVFHPMDRNEARQDLAIPQGQPLVVAIGRLTYQKDPIGFVQIMAKVRERLPGFFGIWIGDGEMRRDMEDAIDRLGVRDAVSVAGWQTDVRPYLGAADLMLLTSVYESYGYVTAEALAVGIPVVATRVTGTVDLLNESVGRLFNSGDLRAGADAVVEILGMTMEERDAMGRAGREFVQSRFSQHSKLMNLQEVYTKAVAIRAGVGPSSIGC